MIAAVARRATRRCWNWLTTEELREATQVELIGAVAAGSLDTLLLSVVDLALDSAVAGPIALH